MSVLEIIRIQEKLAAQESVLAELQRRIQAFSEAVDDLTAGRGSTSVPDEHRPDLFSTGVEDPPPVATIRRRGRA